MVGGDSGSLGKSICYINDRAAAKVSVFKMPIYLVIFALRFRKHRIGLTSTTGMAKSLLVMVTFWQLVALSSTHPAYFWKEIGDVEVTVALTRLTGFLLMLRDWSVGDHGDSQALIDSTSIIWMSVYQFGSLNWDVQLVSFYLNHYLFLGELALCLWWNSWRLLPSLVRMSSASILEIVSFLGFDKREMQDQLSMSLTRWTSYGFRRQGIFNKRMFVDTWPAHMLATSALLICRIFR